MSASNDIAGLQVVARCRDALLVDGGSWWAFGRQRGTGGGVGVFVLGLIAAPMAVASITESVRLLWGAGNWILSAVFAVTAALLAIEAMRELRKIRHARAHAPFELDLLLDFAAAVARDRNGVVIARLDELTFELSEGLRSKSSELECHWEGGKLVLMRTLFAEGHAATPLPALRRLGLRVSTPDILG